MKRQLAIKGLLALVVSVAALLCFVLQPFGSVNADPPVATPTPEKAWLQFDVETLGENPPVLEHDASMSEVESTCISATAQEIFYSIADTEIREGYPTTNYGSSTKMRCGYDDYYDPDGQMMRCLIKFDISSLPTGSTINSAALYVYLVESYDYPGRTRTYTTYRIPSNWSESIVTWSDALPYAEAYGSTGVTDGAWDWYSFDVTSLVQAWHDGTYPNYGIMLRGPEWSGSDSSWKAFSTRESSADPYLVINYTPPPPPTLGVSPTFLRFQAYGTGPNPEPQAVTISNITEGSLDWSAAKVGEASWLEMDETSGSTVTPSSPDTMNVSVVDVSSLAYGTYTGRISVTKTSEPTDCSNRAIDVILEYEAGAPPAQQIFLPIVTKNWDGNALALVVGVAEYPYLVESTGIRAGGGEGEMQYADDDARDIRDAAINLASFSSTNVMTLIDSDATKASIDAGFNWLAARDNKNTLVMISFSGHGGQVPDTAPYDETADGYDEFIGPYDTTLTGDNIILDDELDVWLSRLESENIVVVIDSCYSGGMIDTAGVATGRGIGFVLGTQDVIAQVAEADGLAADISREGRVILTASRTDQVSFEFGALENGVFSYYFIEGLSSTIADGDGNGWISAEEAFSYLECRVDNYVYENTGDVLDGPFNQNPQLYDGTIGEERITQP